MLERTVFSSPPECFIGPSYEGCDEKRLLEAMLRAVPRSRDLRASLNLQCPSEQNVRQYVRRKQPITVIDETLLRRITVNPEIFGGKPIIRGMRISVELILSLLAQGETPETILTDYPDLEPDDLRACLAYAHAVIAHDKLDSVHISG